MKTRYIILTLFPFIASTTLAQNYTGSCQSKVIQHQQYSLCYNEDYEQAFWVSYTLERKEILIPSKKRLNRFLIDNLIPTGSATHNDYTNSGYDRGHLSRAMYNKRTEQSYKESYYMSNISPQIPEFNQKGGDWYKLEQLEIKIAKALGKIECFSGPLFLNDTPKRIGNNKVAIPDAFYKVLYSPKKKKGMGFILIHDTRNYDALERGFKQDFRVDLWDIAAEINYIEKQTGIDFFVGLDESIESVNSSDYFKELVQQVTK